MIEGPTKSTSRAAAAWTWRQFDREVRPRPTRLLERLPDFEDAVLIAGCQRSGTTMLTRIITKSEGMQNFWFGQFPELDAALILSGEVPHEPLGRYCFQTTHVDDDWREYLDAPAQFQLIWCLRNPHSVVTSMLFNWAGFALNDTFRRCGVERLTDRQRRWYGLLGVHAVGRLQRACHVYNSKVSQLFELQPLLGDRMLVVDYDHLTSHRKAELAAIYDFIDLKYDPSYARRIHTKSRKKADRLSMRQRQTIDDMCSDVYRRAQQHCFNFQASSEGNG